MYMLKCERQLIHKSAEPAVSLRLNSLRNKACDSLSCDEVFGQIQFPVIVEGSVTSDIDGCSSLVDKNKEILLKNIKNYLSLQLFV